MSVLNVNENKFYKTNKTLLSNLDYQAYPARRNTQMQYVVMFGCVSLLVPSFWLVYFSFSFSSDSNFPLALLLAGLCMVAPALTPQTCFYLFFCHHCAPCFPCT